MSDLIINEAFNLFVGSAGADNTKHLVIKNLKFPEMEELVERFHAGGSWGAIEVGGLGMKELTVPFKLTGWDPQTLSQFGINGRAKYPFTMYGNARSKATGAAVPIRAVAFGRLTKIAMAEFERGKLADTDYEVKEILNYQLFYGNAEKYYWDWQSTAWRVDGQPMNIDEITNLAIPATSTAVSN